MGAFYAARYPLPSFKKEEINPLDFRFQATDYPRENHAFAILLSSGPTLEKTIRTIASQTYDNYRIFCLDRAAHLALRSTSLEKRSTLVESDEGRLGAILSAIAQCKAREIVMILDARGWLAHEWVLSRLNQYYANPDLWLTYGQDRITPLYNGGTSRSYTATEWAEQKFRTYPFVSAAPYTFYAALFQKIDPKDLAYEGRILPSAIEQAYLFPMLEMGRNHFQCLPDILYLSLDSPPVEDELFGPCDQYLRSLPPYSPLEAL